MALFWSDLLNQWSVRSQIAELRGFRRRASVVQLMKVTNAVCYLEFSGSCEMVVSQPSSDFVTPQALFRCELTDLLCRCPLRPSLIVYILCHL